MSAVELFHASERDVAAELWRAIEPEAPQRALASSWEWIEPWLDHYGDVVPHRFAVARGEGAALVTESVKRRGPLATRSLHLGTSGEPPGETAYASYNALLARPGREAEFARALIARLESERGWDELRLERFAPAAAEPLLGVLTDVAVEHEDAPTVDLRLARENDGDVLATLRARTRQQTRRSMRELGELSVEVAATPEHASGILDELIELHQRRWQAEGEPGVFASARFTGFHRDLIARLLPARRVMLFRVRSAERTVGCIYNLIDGPRVLSYLQGFMPFEDRKLKPGFVSHVLCMQSCFERGYDEYDLLPQASPYKLELSNAMSALVTARVSRRRVGAAVADVSRRARRYVK